MTVHTSELGERLAQKWKGHRFPGMVLKTTPTDYGDVNFWLDAIAEEIDNENVHGYGFECGPDADSDVGEVARWLRGGRDE